MASTPDGPSSGGGKKRKRASAPGLTLGDLHDDMLERVLARLPPSSYSRLRAVSRRWRAAADSPTFRAACARVAARDPWFLMLHDDSDSHHPAAAVFDSAERAWARWRGGPPGPRPMQPVAAAGGLVLYRDAGNGGELTVVNPLTGASRTLPPPPASATSGALQAVAMYGSPAYRVVLVLGELPDGLSTVVYDSRTDSWGPEAALSRQKPAPAQADDDDDEADASAARDHRDVAADDDDTVYYLSKSGDVVATTMQRSAARQYASAVASCPDDGAAAVVYFLSRTGTVVACDVARGAFAELPRILPAYHEYSIDVVACGDGKAVYAVVLSEFLDAASIRVWEFVAPRGGRGGAWRQVAAMPPAMAHAFRGAKADVNCVGHGGRVVVCVSSSGSGSRGGSVGGCFVCDVRTNRWEELPRCGDGEGDDAFVAALSFEPRMEAAV